MRWLSVWALWGLRAIPLLAGAAAGVTSARAGDLPGPSAVAGAVTAAAFTVALLPAIRRLSRIRSGLQLVPRVLGLPLPDAKAALASAGFSVLHTDDDRPPGAPEGVVVTQRPRAGEALRPGGAVRLTTSRHLVR